MPGMGKGRGCAIKSPYKALATRPKPRNPRVFAVSRMAATVDVPFKKPCKNEQITKLPSTFAGCSDSGCWHSSAFVGLLRFAAAAASLAETSLNWKIPSPGVGAVNCSSKERIAFLVGILSFPSD